MEYQNDQKETKDTKADYGLLNNNRVYLAGNIASEPSFSHEVFGEGFYELLLSVGRLSNMADMIPVTLSERLLSDQKIIVGAPLAVKGQFRSYNKLVGDRSKLMLTVFAREVVNNADSHAPFAQSSQASQAAQDQIPNPLFAPDSALNSDNPNVIELTGYICKAPIYRTTPFNREICDLLIAVNRAYNKSDYIPAIAWGRNARFTKNMMIGEKVHLTGRIQSREYQKRLPDDTVETRTAYEISINKISRDAIESQFSETDAAFIAESVEEIEVMA